MRGTKVAVVIILVWLGLLPQAFGAARDITTTNGERRVALVIGNNAYRYVGQLENAVTDARSFKHELEERGFQVVYRENADRHAMNDAIAEFVGRLSTDAIGLVYYSGHGVQINSANYLIPVDLKAEKETDVVDDAVELGRLLDRVSQAQAKFTLAVIDACRNNPFQSAGKSIGGKGLTPPISNASGIMVVYSAGANQQALDRLGGNDKDPNGLFTREFLKAMRVPGITVQDAVNSVKLAVIEKAKSVNHVQTPAIYDQSVGTFYFAGLSSPGPNPAIALPPVPDVSGPSAGNFSLDDLARQESASRAKWDQWQTAMRSAFAQTAAFKGRPELQRAAWDRFLAAYGEKNPYANDDEQLRSEAAQRRAAIQDGPQLASVVSPSASAGSKAPGTVFRDCADCPEMVVIPAGTFTMGSTLERTQHPVTISRAFAAGKYDVTFAEWNACLADGGCNGYRPADQGWGQGNRPVINVSWDDAQAYVTWLNRKVRGTQQVSASGSGTPYRLLTEAEWEYAARGGTATAYSWGEEIGSGNANCFGCGSQWDGKQTSPVGSFRANSFGLYDMAGNVWQWTEDCFADTYAGAPTDGSANERGTACNRVFRGGSWYYGPGVLRSAIRGRGTAGDRYYGLGFRLARTLP